VATYFTAFFLTLLIESAVAIAMGYGDRLLLISLVLVNTATHPVLNVLMLVNAHYGLFPDFPLLVALEIIVVFVEWQLLRDTLRGYPKPLLRLAFWANCTSFSMGVLLYWV
jgi:hypothetical protein